MSGRVLLAEDDAPMRLLLAEVLREDGYEVVEATNGRELFWLLERAEQHGPIDLVLSDLCLDCASGIELVAALRGARVRAGVMLMTGFTSTETLDLAKIYGVEVLDKPFTMDALRAAVRTARGAPS